MSRGPKIQNAELHIRVPESVMAGIRRHAEAQGLTASQYVRAAVAEAEQASSPEQVVRRVRALGCSPRQALVHAATVCSSRSVRSAAARLLAYGEVDVFTGDPSCPDEEGSTVHALLRDLGLEPVYGGLTVEHGRDWWTFRL